MLWYVKCRIEICTSQFLITQVNWFRLVQTQSHFYHRKLANILKWEDETTFFSAFSSISAAFHHCLWLIFCYTVEFESCSENAGNMQTPCRKACFPQLSVIFPQVLCFPPTIQILVRISFFPLALNAKCKWVCLYVFNPKFDFLRPATLQKYQLYRIWMWIWEWWAYIPQHLFGYSQFYHKILNQRCFFYLNWF